MESNTLYIFLRKCMHVTRHKIVGNVFRFGGGRRNVPAMAKCIQDHKYVNDTQPVYMHEYVHRNAQTSRFEWSQSSKK